MAIDHLVVEELQVMGPLGLPCLLDKVKHLEPPLGEVQVGEATLLNILALETPVQALLSKSQPLLLMLLQ